VRGRRPARGGRGEALAPGGSPGPARPLLALGLAALALAGGLDLFASWYSAQPDKFVILFGDSMEPTLSSIDVVYDRPAGTIRRGDIPPYRGTRHRVVVLPGETFEVHQGTVVIDAPGPALVLVEPYVRHNYPWDWPATRLAGDEYVLLGDNRTNAAARTPLLARRADLRVVLDRRVFPPWKRRQF
jgi:hypothetical protein